ncbi:hypothetical protein Zmor_027472 [Zophobas morio]|uniref:Uncharacterized protein n=1 Tax=Zophobas morio TaxID=2755281 RepID=A0AA38M229_9CUCU|nr:hypothetical protein Zmor_027472 [Zophobas morio]
MKPPLTRFSTPIAVGRLADLHYPVTDYIAGLIRRRNSAKKLPQLESWGCERSRLALINKERREDELRIVHQRTVRRVKTAIKISGLSEGSLE